MQEERFLFFSKRKGPDEIETFTASKCMRHLHTFSAFLIFKAILDELGGIFS